MALDWSLLGQGPQFGNVLKSYEAGREARKAEDVKGALGVYATDPEQGVLAMLKVDPETGIKLQDDLKAKRVAATRQGVIQKFDTDPAAARSDAIASGDPEAVKAWESLDKPRREKAHEVADALGTTAFGILRSTPGDTPEALAKRGEMFKGVAPNLLAIGIPKEQVEKVAANPTQAAFDELIAGSQAVLKLKIDDENKRRDDERSQERDDELAGYRDTMAGVAQRNAGTRATVAARPRAAGGSSGGAPAPWKRAW